MTQELIDRLVMIGVAFVGIGQSLYSTQTDAMEIQKRVIMDIYDISEIERKARERDDSYDKEIYHGGYTFILR